MQKPITKDLTRGQQKLNEELKVIITAEIAELKKNVQKAQKDIENFSKESESSLDDFGDSTEKNSSKAGSAMKAVGAAMTGAAAVVGVAVGAMLAAGKAMVDLADNTREFRKEQAQLNSAFQAAGYTSGVASSAYSELFSIIGESDQAVEAAQQIAMLSDSAEDVAKWTELSAGVVAKFGEALQPEAFYEAANETLALGEATGAFAQMLEQSHMSVEDFNYELAACSTEAERQAYLLKVTEEAVGAAGEAYREQAADIIAANEAQNRMNQATAALGAAVEPVVTILRNGLAQVLEQITPYLEIVADGLDKLFDGDISGIETITEGIKGIAGSLSGMLVDILPSAMGIGSSIIGALASSLGEAAPELIKALSSTIEELTTQLPNILSAIVEVLPTLLDTILTEAVKLTPTLIATVIDMILILCESFDSIIKPIIDSIPEVTIAVLEGLMSNLDKLIAGLVTLIVAIVNNIPYILQKLIAALPQIISLIIVGLISALPQLLVGLVKITASVAKAIPSILGAPIDITIRTLQGIWKALEQIFGKVGSWFGDKFKGAVKAIKNAFNGVTTFFSNIWNSIKKTFSKIGSSVGEAISGAVKGAINSVLSSAVDKINGFINAINSAIGIINKIPSVNISKISKLSVPKLAQGGIVDSATLAMVGESGREAIVPLENNTEWIDKLAAKITSATQGGSATPIVLTVDGQVFAKTAVRTMNDLTRASGGLQLRLV